MSLHHSQTASHEKICETSSSNINRQPTFSSFLFIDLLLHSIITTYTTNRNNPHTESSFTRDISNSLEHTKINHNALSHILRLHDPSYYPNHCPHNRLFGPLDRLLRRSYRNPAPRTRLYPERSKRRRRLRHRTFGLVLSWHARQAYRRAILGPW
jgi:hypothetical protein